MRIFALSDVHVDYDANMQWINSLSQVEYVNDVLILAGDISDSAARLERCLNQFARRFRKLLFVPGNHDLWVIRDDKHRNSLDKFRSVCEIAARSGASTAPYHHGRMTIVPLLGWYDYTFGTPETELEGAWMDFYACRWSQAWTMKDVTQHFLRMNNYQRRDNEEIILSFSHFVPRIDVMPQYLPDFSQKLFPVLGSSRLEQQVRQLRSDMHIYGHSHINRRVKLDGTLYINNAFGYPNETNITAKELVCAYECP